MKRYIILLLTVALLITFAACTTSKTAEPTPSPEPVATAEASPTPAPSAETVAEPSASPTVSSMDESVFKPMVSGAKLTYDGKDINAIPYYGINNVILLPLQPLAEAMGWNVENSIAGTSEAWLLTKEGKDDLIIQFITPPTGQKQVSGVTARKGDANINVDPSLFFANGTIYVPAPFISDAMEKIDVSYDGKSVVSVKPGA